MTESILTTSSAFINDNVLVADAAADMRNDDDDANEDEKPWEYLPYNVLVRIVSYLHDSDRFRVALVCRWWCTSTRDPSLWRERQFFLYSAHQTPRHINWLRSHAHHLRHAIVMCFGDFDKNKAAFFARLNCAKLRSLELNGAAYWWSKQHTSHLNEHILEHVVGLILAQTGLVYFQMRQAMLSFQTGVDLLDSLADASGATMTRLGLEDFFGEEENPHHGLSNNSPTVSQTVQFTRCVSRFPHLSVLTTNYQYVTDSLLEWFSHNRRRQSVTLNLISWQGNLPLWKNAITAYTWRRFAQSCSPARVCLTLQNIKNIERVISAILLQTIPMHSLSLLGLTATNEREAGQLRRLLKHVHMSYGNSLVAFKLWGNNKLCDKLEDSMLRLVTQCTALCDLDLHMDVEPGLMGRVCRLQQTGQANLQSFRMARSLSHSAEFDEFRRQIHFWFPVFKSLKLDFQIRAESSPNHSAFRTYSFLVADNRGIIDHVDGRDQARRWRNRLTASNGGGSSSSSSDSNNNYSNNNNNTSNNNINSDIISESLWDLLKTDVVFSVTNFITSCYLDFTSGKSSGNVF